MTGIAGQIELAWHFNPAEPRGPHGEWVKGPDRNYELPDPDRLYSARSPYHRPEDHPFFQRNPVSPKHIADAYDQSSDQEREQGMRWYPDGQELAAAIGQGDLEKGAGVLSAFSPQTGWAVNMRNAAKSLQLGRALGPGEGMITGNMQRQAQKMIDGGKIEDVFKAPKTLAFARLLKHGEDPPEEKLGNVVIDRHALSVAVGHRMTRDELDDSPIGDNRYYQHVADQYRQAAAAISKRDGKQVTPSQLQAITWLHQQTANQDEDSSTRGRLGRGRETSLRNAWAAWTDYDWKNNLPGRIGTTWLPGAAISEDVRHSPEGFSISLAKGKSPDTGFMVAQNDATHTFPASVMEDRQALADAIDSYLMSEPVFREPGMYLGGWVHDGKLWLEPSQNVADHDEAVELAKARNQIAIWDVDHGQEIETGGSGGGRVIEHGPEGANAEGHFGSTPGELGTAVSGGAATDLAGAGRPAPGGIAAQIELAEGNPLAYLHESRASDGRWVHGVGSQADGTVIDKMITPGKAEEQLRQLEHEAKDGVERKLVHSAIGWLTYTPMPSSQAVLNAAGKMRTAARRAADLGHTDRAEHYDIAAGRLEDLSVRMETHPEEFDPDASYHSAESAAFVSKGAGIVPGLLGGKGKETWNGTVSIFPQSTRPAVAGEMTWRAQMNLSDDVDKAVKDAKARKPVQDEGMLLVPLHELIHGVVAPDDEYGKNEAAYQDPAGADIEEGFTELGTIQHASEFLDKMGMGKLDTPITATEPGIQINEKALYDSQSELEKLRTLLGSDGGYAGSLAAYNAITAARNTFIYSNPLDSEEIVRNLQMALNNTRNEEAKKRITALLDSAGVSGKIRHATAAEWAQRVNDPDRIADGDAWGHYATQTARAQAWTQSVAGAEGLPTGTPQHLTRMRELADEINSQGPAGKIHVMAEQVARASGAEPAPGTGRWPADTFRLHGFPQGHTHHLMSPNDWSELESSILEQWSKDVEPSEIVNELRQAVQSRDVVDYLEGP